MCLYNSVISFLQSCTVDVLLNADFNTFCVSSSILLCPDTTLCVVILDVIVLCYPCAC